uniref:Uncharacterized protein n=1 Tax=Tanacetum cinerariifolium TaxID=118510 RepID=A0A6L2MJL5_TANCI|nr:hypothetical protein [Tanacetum cinerariifolium]
MNTMKSGRHRWWCSPEVMVVVVDRGVLLLAVVVTEVIVVNLGMVVDVIVVKETVEEEVRWRKRGGGGSPIAKVDDIDGIRINVVDGWLSTRISHLSNLYEHDNCVVLFRPRLIVRFVPKNSTYEMSLIVVSIVRGCDDCDDDFMFMVRGSPTPISWLGSHTERLTAAMAGDWYPYTIRKPEPYCNYVSLG